MLYSHFNCIHNKFLFIIVFLAKLMQFRMRYLRSLMHINCQSCYCYSKVFYNSYVHLKPSCTYTLFISTCLFVFLRKSILVCTNTLLNLIYIFLIVILIFHRCINLLVELFIKNTSTVISFEIKLADGYIKSFIFMSIYISASIEKYSIYNFALDFF